VEEEQMAVQGSDLVATWARRCLARLGEEREAIDRLNVFPVPDGDTGTNMYLTMESGVAAIDSLRSDRPDGELGQRWAGADPAALRFLAVLQALARGALLGARGNSGVILSQILRGLLHGRIRPDPGSPVGVDLAYGVSTAFASAADLAYGAVGSPQEGTILTVMRVAADRSAAARKVGAGLVGVVEAAADGAREALARTPEQLPALAKAGVVDSGGAGLVVVLDCMVEVLTGKVRAAAADVRRPQAPPMAQHGPMAGYDGPGYEVMYLLDAADSAVPALKQELGALGDSLVVVGGDGLWNVHVHVEDAGAAVEAGMAAGRPHRIRITWLRTPLDTAAAPQRGGRRVVAVSHGPGVQAMLQEAGAVAVPARPRVAPSTGELLTAIEGSGAAEVVLLPGGKDIRAAAEAAATRARKAGVRVGVIPTRAIVQSLAALAVHDPERDFDDDVAAMGRAAGACAYGAVTVASREATTKAGPVAPGDVLGLVGGEILVIGADESEVALTVLDRMVHGHAGLVTLLGGADMPVEELEELGNRIEAAHPDLEVVAEAGGQPLWPVIIGVE
jgi:DAK2 domain fusion protein YloV